MKKKALALMLALAMTVCAAGCGGTDTSENTESNESTETGAEEGEGETGTADTGEVAMPAASGEKLVVGTLANWVGLPAWYAQEQGYYEEVGLDVEIVNFGSQGTLVNEAMAADECDIAVSGMASVYALGTGMYSYIGDGCLTIRGATLYC